MRVKLYIWWRRFENEWQILRTSFRHNSWQSYSFNPDTDMVTTEEIELPVRAANEKNNTQNN